jgi:colanic acid/amylovoran biosynthesis protein
MHAWIVGHGGFYNRGCEAIVRSSLALIAGRFPGCRFTLWSSYAEHDAPALRGQPVRVLDAGKWRGPMDLCRACRKLRQVPGGGLARTLIRSLPAFPSVGLSVGGDNFSLDYNDLMLHVETGELLLDAGVPLAIWGASIGPFDRQPATERRMAEFLARANLITARESLTVAYLDSLGVRDNVVPVVDPAFTLAAEPRPGPEADFVGSGGVLGFNLSALMGDWFPGGLERLLDEAAAFLLEMTSRGHRVLLVPHVSSAQRPLESNDAQFLGMLLARAAAGADRTLLLSGDVPATQIKWLISQCRFFIGARTHATIAAISTGVPTIAVGYSMKSRGIWRDVFGDERLVLPVGDLSRQTLLDAWDQLVAEESALRSLLAQRRDSLLAGARRNVEALADLLAGHRLKSAETDVSTMALPVGER